LREKEFRKKNRMTLQMLFNDARMADIFNALDQLHDAATERELESITSLRKTERVEWMKEYIFTAEQIIAEIEGAETPKAPSLMVLPRAVGDKASVRRR
jgi:hypothetical protein